MVERVAAVDVAKASGKVCMRVPHPAAGRRVTKVWDVAATTNAIVELADELARERDRAGRPGVDFGLLAAVRSTCWRRGGWTCGW